MPWLSFGYSYPRQKKRERTAGFVVEYASRQQGHYLGKREPDNSFCRLRLPNVNDLIFGNVAKESSTLVRLANRNFYFARRTKTCRNRDCRRSKFRNGSADPVPSRAGRRTGAGCLHARNPDLSPVQNYYQRSADPSRSPLASVRAHGHA